MKKVEIKPTDRDTGSLSKQNWMALPKKLTVSRPILE